MNIKDGVEKEHNVISDTVSHLWLFYVNKMIFDWFATPIIKVILFICKIQVSDESVDSDTVTDLEPSDVKFR